MKTSSDAWLVAELEEPFNELMRPGSEISLLISCNPTGTKKNAVKRLQEQSEHAIHFLLGDQARIPVEFAYHQNKEWQNYRGKANVPHSSMLD